MVGTMPLTSQLPTSAPTISRIRIAGAAARMFSSILACMSDQRTPSGRLSAEASAADRINAI